MPTTVHILKYGYSQSKLVHGSNLSAFFVNAHRAKLALAAHKKEHCPHFVLRTISAAGDQASDV